MAFTRITDPTNNIANLANQPVEPPATLKQKFDQIGEDLKDYNNNTLLVELESTTNGDSGADNIGATSLTGGVATTVQGVVEELDAKINSQLPTPPDSITNAKLAVDVKVGSLASLSALLVGFTSSVTVAINKIVSWIGDLSMLTTTVKTSLVGAINEVDAEVALKANKTQENWIAPTLLNSWVNFGSPYDEVEYFKDDFGIVHITGVLKSGIAQHIFTLPVGYRPVANIIVPAMINNASAFVTILLNGDVVINSSGGVTSASISSITFRAV